MRALAQRLTAFELPLVGVAVAGCLVTDRMLLPTLVLAAVFWALHWIATGSPRRRTPADLPIIGLVLLLPITLTITAQPATTQVQVLRLLVGIALFYSITAWTTSLPRLQVSLAGLILLGMMLALAAPVLIDWQIFPLSILPSSLIQLQPFVLGDGVNPNVLAGQFALLMPLAVALLIAPLPAPRLLVRLAASIALTIMGVVLILTESRGALLATGVAMFVIALIGWKHRILLGSLVLVGAAIFWLIGGVQSLIADTNLGGLSGRLEIWSRASYMLQDFPFTGIGMGSFLFVVETLYPYTTILPGRGEHAHNLFLQIGADLGLAGLFLWISILLCCVWAAWQAHQQARHQGQAWVAAIALGVLGSQMALLTHGMVDAVTWGMVKPAPLVWAVWGVGCAAFALAHPHTPNPLPARNAELS